MTPINCPVCSAQYRRHPILRQLDTSLLNILRTILFSTQDIEEAERYANRIAILHKGNIKMDGTLERLIETTHGLTRYRLSFSQSPTDDFMDKLKEFPRILRPQVKGTELEFYSRERKQFFKALELALKYELEDIDTSIDLVQNSNSFIEMPVSIIKNYAFYIDKILSSNSKIIFSSSVNSIGCRVTKYKSKYISLKARSVLNESISNV